MRRLLCAAAALLWPALAPAAQSGEPMAWPEPIQWGEFLDTTRVSGALLEALANSKWLVEADTGESITARYEVRVHVLRIRIDYGPQRVSYHYVDSENYAYEEENGERYIHRRANKIMGRLDKEVRIQLQRARFQREPLQVVPVEPPADAAPPEPAPGGP